MSHIKAGHILSIYTDIKAQQYKYKGHNNGINNGNDGGNDDSENNNGMVYVRKYIHTMLAGATELTVGQPLDRLKIYYQTPIHSRGESLRLPTPSNWRYWYAGNLPAAIQRCALYFPTITMSSSLTDIMITDNTSNTSLLIKPFIVSSAVTPYVTIFEFIKNIQQQHHTFMNNPNAKYGTSNNSITSSIITTSTNKRGIYGIVKTYGLGNLSAAWFPTFGREYFFAGGMLVIQPMLAHTIADNYPNIPTGVGWAISSLGASSISQIISQPLDTWKTRIELAPRTSIWETARNIPINQLWSGLTPRIIRGAWTFGCINGVLKYLDGR